MSLNLMMRDRDNFERGRREGFQQGLEEAEAMSQWLYIRGGMEAVKRAAFDEDYRKQMLNEYAAVSVK